MDDVRTLRLYDETHAHIASADFLVVVELSSAIFESADGWRRERAVGEVRVAERPLSRAGIVEP